MGVVIMSIGIGVGFTKDKESGTSSGQSTSASEEKLSSSEIETAIQNLLRVASETSSSDKTADQSGSETTNQASSALGQESLGDLQDLIGDLVTQLQDNEELELADIDFEAINQASVQNVLDQGIANVIGINSASGTFQNSATADAAARLGAQAANAGAGAEQQARLEQNKTAASAGLQQNSDMLGAIAQLFQIEKGAEVITSADSTNVLTSAESGTSSKTSAESATTDSTKSTETDILKSLRKRTEESGTTFGKKSGSSVSGDVGV